MDGVTAVPAPAAAGQCGATGERAAAGVRAGTGVRAEARITARPDGRGGTALPVLAGAGPIAPRRTRDHGRAARVLLIGSMAAPLGGDRLALRVEVEPGAALSVGSAAATISLPGRDGAPAHYELHLTVGEDAELHWLPEPVVAAAGSHLITRTRIALAPGARLRYREELVLGRHLDHTGGRPPGRLTSRLTVHRAGRPLLDQQTDLGPGAPGWDGPAVLAEHRAAGQLLTVGLAPPQAPPAGTDAALLVLAEPDATLLTVLGPDALAVRRLLPAQ